MNTPNPVRIAALPFVLVARAILRLLFFIPRLVKKIMDMGGRGGIYL